MRVIVSVVILSMLISSSKVNRWRYRMKSAIRLVLGVLSATPAFGSDALPGRLSLPAFMSDGYVIVTTDGQRSSNPCTSTYPQRYALNATTAAGKIQLAGLLSAHAAGLPVRIIGTGSCSPHNEELISYFYIAD